MVHLLVCVIHAVYILSFVCTPALQPMHARAHTHTHTHTQSAARYDARHLGELSKHLWST